MPKTAKGKKIHAAMVEQYGSQKKADAVFYASKNKGTISGVDKPKKKKKTGGGLMN